MKISIITVVYNNAQTIRDAIQSVLSQDYPNIEYIIIDGGSSDGTLSIINEYKEQISYFISERDNGLYDAMNKGIRVSTGEIIGILNSDDLYANQKVISDVIMRFKINSDLSILYGDLVYVKYSNVSKTIRTWKSIAYYDKYFEHANVPPHPSLFLKSNIFERVSLFNLDFKLAADYEFMFRLLKLNSFKTQYVNQTFVKMRLGGTTNKSLSNILKQNKEIFKAWRINGKTPPFYFFPLKFLKRLTQFI